MIKYGRVQPKGCIYELYSDISLNMEDMRSSFGYKLLSEIRPLAIGDKYEINVLY